MRPVKTQISLGIHPVWSETSLCTQWVAKDPRCHHVDREDIDQTGQMPRLIGVFAGRTCHFVGFIMRRLKYLHDPKYSDRQIWANSACRPRSDCSLSSLIRVYTVCHSVCIFWTLYCMVKPPCSNFRIITAIFWGVWIFWIVMVSGQVLLTYSLGAAYDMT